MRVRHVLLSLCISLLTQIVTQIAAATEEEELPALELLGFIADFSDDDEGWVDPQELEELLSLVSDTAEPNEDSEATEEPNTHSAAD